MRFRHMGDSGLVVSVLGLGCNNFGKTLDRDESRVVVEAAIESGVTLFNTGDTYGRRNGHAYPWSEEFLGEILKGRRGEVVLATKFGNDMLGENGPDWGARGSRRYIRRAVERSLDKLQTDWIDLYELHNPDPATPIEETLATLTDLVHEGKVRYLGYSNAAAWQLTAADWTARSTGLERFVCAENEYSLLERSVERDIVPACRAHGIGLLPYFPLANGLLTGKYERGAPLPEGSRLIRWGMQDYLTADRLDRVDSVRDFALDRSISMLDVAIGGLAAQPQVASVIAGATTPDQVRANVAAADWEPTPDDLRALDEVVPGHGGS